LIQVFCDFGLPKVIQSDNGTEYVNELVELFAKMAGIDHRLISAYHPRANGLAERYVKSAVNTVRKAMDINVIDWDYYVPGVQLSLNNKTSERTKSAPFTLMFARTLNGFQDYSTAKPMKPMPNKELLKRIEDMSNVVFPAVRDRVQLVKSKQTQSYNDAHKMVDFPIGSHAMLKKPIKATKLEAPYTGPYEIMRKTQGGSYLLKDTQANELLSKGYPPSAPKLISQDESTSIDNVYV